MKRIVLGIILLLGTALLLTAGIKVNDSANKVEGEAHYKGKVCIQKNNEEVYCNSNLIVNQGKDWIADMISGNANTSQILKYISVLSGSVPTASSTSCNDLTTNGFSRAGGTVYDTGTGTFNVTKTFTATGSVTDLNVTCLYYYSGGNTLVAGSSFPAVNMEANDKLTINWSIQIS